MNAAKIVFGTVVAVGLTASVALGFSLKNGPKKINSENIKNMTEQLVSYGKRILNGNENPKNMTEQLVKPENTTATPSAWATAEAFVTDTIHCPKDTFWCKLTPEEAEYMRTLIEYDAPYSDTIKTMSVDAAKKAYAEAKNAAKRIR